MVKKVLTLFLGLIAASSLMAQSEPKSVTINESDIQFWVGNGSNSSVVAIGWDATDAGYTPTVVVWGIHWNGSITLLDALDSIATHDSRFTYTVSGSFLSTLDYNDPTASVHLSPHQMWNCNSYNGMYGSTTLTSTWLRISESTCDNYNFTGVNNLIYASDPNGPATTDPVDATIDTTSIVYWVGTGDKRAVFIVNWGSPDTALAWGYRFNSGATINNMIADIDAADPRFWIEGTPSYNGDIHFVTSTGDTLGLSPVDPTIGYNFWWTNLNGVSVASFSTALQDNDFFKYGDINASTGWDYQFGYYQQEAWTTTPTPVPAPGNDPETPVEATIAANDILYWVGEGSNQAVLAVNWADTALAWGYRYEGSKTVSDMLNDIAAADPRFSIQLGDWGLDDILFVTATGDTLRKQTYSYWESKNNGTYDMGMGQTLTNGDFEKWGEPAAGTVVDSTYYDGWGWSYTYVYTMGISPVSVPAGPMPEEATIAANDILYWVGEGSNQAVLAVNWADTALAWGYRYEGSKTVSDMLNDIAAADPRFSIQLGDWGLDDILFVTATGDTLRKQTYSYWESKNNGTYDMGMGQTLTNGDFEKWGEPAAGTVVDSTYYDGWGWSYTYVYTMEISPVSAPAPVSINTIAEESISVYPNPSAGSIVVKSTGSENAAILYDMRGSVVATYAIENAETRIDLGNIPNGIYLIRLGTHSTKLVVRH